MAGFAANSMITQASQSVKAFVYLVFRGLNKRSAGLYLDL
jgi:hypothetical protein